MWLLAQPCLTLCDSMGCSPPGSSVLGDSPDKNTGVGCHALRQGIFPTQGLNPGRLPCGQILHRLSHQGHLTVLFWKLLQFFLPPGLEFLQLLSQQALCKETLIWDPFFPLHLSCPPPRKNALSLDSTCFVGLVQSPVLVDLSLTWLPGGRHCVYRLCFYFLLPALCCYFWVALLVPQNYKNTGLP